MGMEKLRLFSKEVPKPPDPAEKLRQPHVAIEKLSREEAERTLRGQVIRMDEKLNTAREGDIRNARLKVELPNAYAAFIPERIENMNGNLIAQNIEYTNEKFAQLVSDTFQFDVLPPSVDTHIGDRAGLMVGYIEDAIPGAALEPTEGIKRQLIQLTLLDIILNNTDRRSLNVLYKDGRIYGIDHEDQEQDRSPLLDGWEQIQGERIPDDIREAFLSACNNAEKMRHLREEMLRAASGNKEQSEKLVNKYFDRIAKLKTVVEEGVMPAQDPNEYSPYSYRALVLRTAGDEVRKNIEMYDSAMKRAA
jgi:hypothetical protein